jgi:hypothetical protein
MKLKTIITAFAVATTAAANGALYISDFQSDAVGSTPAGWTNVRAFSGVGTSTEGGANDRAIIKQSGDGAYTAVLNLGQAGVIGNVITLSLNYGQYSTNGSSSVFWQLGTVSGAGVFTSFSETRQTASTTGTNFWGATNGEVAGTAYTHTFTIADSSNNLAVQLGATASTGFGGFDNVIVTIPEPSAALLGALGVLGLLRRRR